MSHLHLAGPDDIDLAGRASEILARYKASGYSTMMAVAGAPIVVPCPHCRAIPGMACQTRNGYVYAGGHHALRQRAVAHLTDDEKIAAMAALTAGQEQAQARLRATSLTPAQLATRATVDRMFAEVDAQLRAEDTEIRRRCYRPRGHASDCTCRTDFFEEKR
jgi:hypothetical protein